MGIFSSIIRGLRGSRKQAKPSTRRQSASAGFTPERRETRNADDGSSVLTGMLIGSVQPDNSRGCETSHTHDSGSWYSGGDGGSSGGDSGSSCGGGD